MRIEAIRSEAEGRVRRLAARIVWEENARPAGDVFFELEDAPDGGADPHPFVAGLAVPALAAGERRIAFEGALCPRLRDGIALASRLLRSWFPELGADPALEPSRGFAPLRPSSEPRAGLFLSGGVDSLFSLFQNRDAFPLGHPASFCRAIFVRELVFPDSARQVRSADLDRRALGAVNAIADHAALAVSVVRTNLASALDDYDGHAKYWSGSFLAAIAHAFPAGLTEAAIAATHDVSRLPPWGTDPILDPAFSTSALAIRHDGVEATRFAKVRAISRRDTALENLVVCGESPLAGPWKNCGSCERCVRTRLALLAAGALERAATFPPLALDHAVLDAIPSSSRTRSYWPQLVEPLRSAGREDLARSIAERGLRERAAQEWSEDRGWKGALRRGDRRWFGGRLLEWRRRAPRSPGRVRPGGEA
jgi:hypothetical protein